MKSFKYSIMIWAVTIIGIGIGIVQSKILAVELGPAGLGIFGQCTTLIAFIGLPIANGILPAANRYIPANRSAGADEEVSRWVISTRTLSFGLGFLLMIIIIPFSRIISHYLLGDSTYFPLIILSAVAIPLFAFSLTEKTLIQSFEQIKLWSISTLLISLIGLPIFIVLIDSYGLYGAVFQIIMIGLLGGVLATFFYKRFRGMHAEPLLKFNWDTKIIGIVSKFGGATLFSAIIFSAVILFVRSLIINTLGVTESGIYHAISSISLQYLSIGLFSVSVYWYPRLARINDKDQIVVELNKFLRISFLIITPLFVILMALRTQIIYFVYSWSFAEAIELIPLQIVGDYFRIIFWIISASLLPMVRIKEFLGLSISYSIALACLSWYFLDHFGLEGAILAYVVINFIWAIVTYILQRRLIGFRFFGPNLRLVTSTGMVICFSFLIGGSSLSPSKFILLIGSLALWLFVSSTPAERQFIKHPEILFSRLLNTH